MANNGELFDSLVQNGSYSEKEACLTIKYLFDAIHHLHRKGIVQYVIVLYLVNYIQLLIFFFL